jgi:hypothetical protein
LFLLRIIHLAFKLFLLLGLDKKVTSFILYYLKNKSEERCLLTAKGSQKLGSPPSIEYFFQCTHIPLIITKNLKIYSSGSVNNYDKTEQALDSVQIQHRMLIFFRTNKILFD